ASKCLWGFLPPPTRSLNERPHSPCAEQIPRYRASADPARAGRRGDRVRRRAFITLLGGGAVAWPLAARAQQPGRVYRIGVLELSPGASNAANFDALRKGLRELGYVEGQNLVLDYRSADGRAERFPQLAAELLRLNVDLIVTRGTPAVMAAK